MTVRRSRIPLAILLLWAWTDRAEAQSPSTCAFDVGAAAVTVTVDSEPAHLLAAQATGEIRLNGVPCGGATVLNTDSIQVNGGLLEDTVTLTGAFAPGLTPEASGASEIEISFAFGDSWDRVNLNLTSRRDRLVFTSDGIDIGEDLDRDIFTGGVEIIMVNAGDGNDRVDASAYTSSATRFELRGEGGDDTLIAAELSPNFLFGDAGNDRLYGGASGDKLHGGPGNDLVNGGGGPDHLFMEASADGADELRGGEGFDWVRYEERQNGLTITVGDDQPDGEPGEGDLVRGDVELVQGGRGPDVLVGNSGANTLVGLFGDDQLYGGGGDDRLDGGGGNDILVGDAGNDWLRGSLGADALDGGAGNDLLEGDDGRDTIQGGTGSDTVDGGEGRDELFGDDDNDNMMNADGFADTVNCGAGASDNAEPDPLDTFISCELI